MGAVFREGLVPFTHKFDFVLLVVAATSTDAVSLLKEVSVKTGRAVADKRAAALLTVGGEAGLEFQLINSNFR